MNYFSDFWNRLLDATTGSLKTSIVDGSGSQITSFGGGTQYTEGDTDASVTGTAILWEDTSDTLRAASAAKPLPVDVKSVAPGTYAVDDSAMPATPQTVPVSGEYRSAATTYTDGDVTVLQTDVNGNIKNTLATGIAGEDLANDVLKTEQRWSAANITLAAPTTTLIKTGVGLLHAVIINKPLANGVIAIYDGVDATGTLLATITKPATLLSDQVNTILYDISFSIGLCIVTSGAAQDVTVAYR